MHMYLKPFPEDEFKPIEWRGILATLDICVNETTPTVFCDEEGYNVIPICMIKVSHKNGLLDDTIHKGKRVQKLVPQTRSKKSLM